MVRFQSSGIQNYSQKRTPCCEGGLGCRVRVVKYCPNVTSCHLDTLTSLPNSKIHGSRVDFTDSPMCVVVHNQSSYSIEPYVPFRVIQSKWVFFTTPCFDRGGQLCFLDVVLCQQQFFLFIVVFYCSVLMLTHTVVISQKKGAKQKKIVLELGSAQLYPKFFPEEKWYLEEYLVVLQDLFYLEQ